MADRKTAQTFNLDRLKTPIGTALLVTDDDGVLRALDWDDYEGRMLDLLRLHYGVVTLRDGRAPAAMRKALGDYFNGDLGRLADVEWRVAGTPFQQKVWHALPKIPPGTTMSYGALAVRLKMPNAMRAVGHANGSNPISVVVPCHRVVRADGAAGHYLYGTAAKQALLTHEAAHAG